MFSKNICYGRARIGDSASLLSLKNGWGEQIEKFNINSHFVDSVLWIMQENCVPSIYVGRGRWKSKNLNPNSCSLSSGHCLLPFPELKCFSVGYYFVEDRAGTEDHVLVKTAN